MWFQIKNSNNTFSRKCNKTNRFHKFQYTNLSNKFRHNSKINFNSISNSNNNNLFKSSLNN